MITENDPAAKHGQEETEPERWLITRLEAVLGPLPERLDAYVDRRLVTTCLELLAAIICHVHPKQGLHVSRLGAYIKSGEEAPAGAKKIENLLHSEKWGDDLIKDFLWEKAKEEMRKIKGRGKQVLCIHDGSRLEKPESEQTDGFCSVLSSKAKRLRKNRKGIWNPPGGKPITVLGLEWNAVMVTGMDGVPQVATMEYWSRKGAEATTQQDVEKRMLRQCLMHLGRDVLHVFDRGYASKAWLEEWSMWKVAFVTRWKGGHNFFDVEGKEKLLWQIARGKRTWGYREIQDPKTNKWVRTGVVAMRVKHVGYTGQLWLVVGRGKGDPWYLITNQPVETEEEAWRIVMAYARRWKIEECFRFEKSELGVESVCVRSWKAREKLLAIVSLVYRYLLSLCDPEVEWIRTWLLRHHCHRTGKRLRQVKMPMYRLRWALADLWQKTNPLPQIARLFQALFTPNICSESSG
jgi:hypothetical protein